MINELLFFVAVFINLTFILFSFRYGKTGLIITTTVNLILVSTFAVKLVSLFGFTSNVGNIYYGSLFLATNLLVEHYGRKEGFKAVWIAFIGNMLFVIMGQFSLRFLGDGLSISANDAISVLFANTPRIALASITAYLLVQNLNVWCFDFIKRKTNGKHLWLRHGISTTLAQFLDSLLFFSIAFYMIIPTNVLIEAMITGFVLKAIIGFVTIPVMYLGSFVKPQKEEEDVT